MSFGVIASSGTRIKIGNLLSDLSSTNNYVTDNFVVAFQSPSANLAGVITKAWFRPYSGGTVHVVIGSLSGNNFTVRSVSGSFSIASGIQQLSVNMAVQPGDYIGIYTVSGTPSVGGFFGFGGAYLKANLGALPTVSQVIAMTTDLAGIVYAGGEG